MRHTIRSIKSTSSRNVLHVIRFENFLRREEPFSGVFIGYCDVNDQRFLFFINEARF